MGPGGLDLSPGGPESGPGGLELGAAGPESGSGGPELEPGGPESGLDGPELGPGARRRSGRCQSRWALSYVGRGEGSAVRRAVITSVPSSTW
ncbi:hypothetical protein GCM10023100_66440 [Actinocorallia cavernae]|uniref:Uncharacterized protein n=2 Tax=Actinomycetes TaxID=1760 RepID=A0ABN3M815_9ACTN